MKLKRVEAEQLKLKARPKERAKHKKDLVLKHVSLGFEFACIAADSCLAFPVGML